MSESGDFNHFLKALDEIEGQAGDGHYCGCKKTETIPRELTSHSSCDKTQNQSSLRWVTEIRKGIARRKPMRYSLQRPGFVYRKKNLSNSSYLDNNLWEYTCGRQVLKSPSFKYRKKTDGFTSICSVLILEDLSNLSLNSNPNQPCTISRKLLNTTDTAPNANNRAIEFAPLSTTISFRHQIRSKRLVRPAKLTKTCTKKFSFNTVDNSSFGDLSKGAMQDTRAFDSSGGKWRHKNFSNCEFSPVPPPIKESPTEPCEKKTVTGIEHSCSYQARICDQDTSADELSIYMEDMLFLPQKMSSMAEMMYT